MDSPSKPPPPPAKTPALHSPRAAANAAAQQPHGAIRAPHPELVLEHIPHMVVQTGVDGLAVFSNSKWVEYTGLTLAETRTRWFDVVHAEDAEVARSSFKKCLKDAYSFDIDYRIRRVFDGEYRWFRVHSAPFVRDDLTSIIFTITDIHIEKTLTQAHQDSIGRDEIFHRRVRLASDPIITIDAADNTILTFNRAAERELQYSQREVLGQKFTILMDERAAERHMGPNGYITQYDRTARKGHQLTVGNSRQLLARRKDGVSVPITLMIDMYFNKAGCRVYIAVLQIVTQELNLQQELHKSKDTFLSTMSHELRTPLFGLLGMMSMLRPPPDVETRRELRQMEQCTTSLLAIVNNMIDYYKLENLSVTPLALPFQPRVLLAEVCAHLYSSIQGGVEFEQKVKDHVPHVLVTDSNFIKHIISNLLANALRFTPQGKVSVVLSVVDGTSMKAHELLQVQQGQTVLQILISDTGIGIEAEFYPKVFRPFSQMDNSNSRQYGGVGLGLAISKCMVDMMGGVISFKSSVGHGSEFKVLVPVDMLEAPQCPDRNGSLPFEIPFGSTSPIGPPSTYPPTPPTSPFNSPISPRAASLPSRTCPTSPRTPSLSCPIFPASPTQFRDPTCPVRRSLFPSSIPVSPSPPTPRTHPPTTPTIITPPATSPPIISSPLSTHPSTAPTPIIRPLDAAAPFLPTPHHTSPRKAQPELYISDKVCPHTSPSITCYSPTSIPPTNFPSPASSPPSSPTASRIPPFASECAPSMSHSPPHSPPCHGFLANSPVVVPRFPILSYSPTNLARSDFPSNKPVPPHKTRSMSSPFPSHASTTVSMSSTSPLPVLGLRVLVVEDNIMNQTVIKKMLLRMECTVVVAKHGQEALDILIDSSSKSFVGYSKFQLVLMDCQMPVLDGYQATIQLRNWERRQTDSPHLRIIALTASSSSENEKQCYRAGMNGFIAKPITLHGLYHYIAAE